tara:strand:+ start:5679 stop:5849 length:171 start_codon:yes stop_codon:yes gene_type:complete
MVEQNGTIDITSADVGAVLQAKTTQITNLELQVAALKRTIEDMMKEPEVVDEPADE